VGTSQREVVCSDGKEEKIMRRMFGFLIGITVGGLVGSTIALLMAPESGEQLRSELRMRGDSFFNEVRHAADERRIELRQRLETMRTPRLEE
jgi:gas vesicle protein